MSYLRPEGGERVSLAYIWGKNIPGGGKGTCKAPEMGMCLMCS